MKNITFGFLHEICDLIAKFFISVYIFFFVVILLSAVRNLRNVQIRGFINIKININVY